MASESFRSDGGAVAFRMQFSRSRIFRYCGVWQDGVGICFNVTEQFSLLQDVLARRVDLSKSELLDLHKDAGAALDCRGGAAAELREALARHVFGDDDSAVAK